MSGLVLRTSMTPGCEARSLWLRPILDDSHFTTACDTSNMASVFRLIYAHEVRTGAKFAPSFAIRGKTCGPMGRRPTFCWGPSTRRAARIRAVGRIFQIRLWELAARAQTCGSSRREHKNFRKFQVSLPQISTCKLKIHYISFYFYCHVPPKIAKNCRTWHKFEGKIDWAKWETIDWAKW